MDIVQFTPEERHKKTIIKWIVTIAAVSGWIAAALLSAEEPAKWEDQQAA